MGDHTKDDQTEDDELGPDVPGSDPLGSDVPGSDLDGSGLVRSFERAKDRALSEASGETVRERAEWVLEATAYVSALDVIGRLSSVVRGDREALAARARRTLLSLAGLAVDEDDRDALDLAARYAREGLRALSGAAVEAPRGDEPPPPVRDLVRLVRGELDGFASADVALRLRGSARGRAELARVVPSIVSPAVSRFRVAADSLGPEAGLGSVVRDPREGRAIGSLAVGDGALEAFVFPDGALPTYTALAIYADPPLSLGVAGAGIEVQSRSPGYVEVRIVDGTHPLTLRVEYGDRSFEWVLSLG